MFYKTSFLDIQFDFKKNTNAIYYFDCCKIMIVLGILQSVSTWIISPKQKKPKKVFPQNKESDDFLLKEPNCLTFFQSFIVLNKIVLTLLVFWNLTAQWPRVPNKGQHYLPFTCNVDVSTWVNNSRVGRKSLNN